MGRTGDEGQFARTQHVQADHGHESVRAALGHGNAGRQAQFLGHFRQQRAGDLAHVQDALRETRQQVAQADLLVEIGRPAALGPVVVPADAGVVDAADPLAGQPVGQPVDELADVAGLAVGFRLVFLEPEDLAGQPFGRDVAVAVVLQGRMAAGRDAPGLVGRAHVHPDDGRAQRPEMLVQGHDGATGAIGPQPDDLFFGDAAFGQRRARGRDQGRPPLVGLLLGPAGLGMIERIGLRREHQRHAGLVEDPDPHAFRAEVDAEDIRTCHS